MGKPLASTLCLLLAALSVAPRLASAQEITEPASSVKFAAKDGDLSLLGVGLRTKTFLRVKVYAIGFYVADSALVGSLAAYKGKVDSPGFYGELVQGDFPKQVRLKFVRDVSADKIQEAMREALAGASTAPLDAFVGYFPALKTGDECVLRWAPGGTLETTTAGQAKPPIVDRAFAAALFGVWLGPKPIQEDIKKALVSRAGELLK
jgi:hypothetical protein